MDIPPRQAETYLQERVELIRHLIGAREMIGHAKAMAHAFINVQFGGGDPIQHQEALDHALAQAIRRAHGSEDRRNMLVAAINVNRIVSCASVGCPSAICASMALTLSASG